MTAEGHTVALLPEELTIEQRIQVLNRFRDGLEKILITTNVLSRGIDVEQVIFRWRGERLPWLYCYCPRWLLWSILTFQWMWPGQWTERLIYTGWWLYWSSLVWRWVYRIGRTCRFGKLGLAINLVGVPKSMAVLKEIERHFGKDIVKLDAEVKSF